MALTRRKMILGAVALLLLVFLYRLLTVYTVRSASAVRRRSTRACAV